MVWERSLAWAPEYLKAYLPPDRFLSAQYVPNTMTEAEIVELRRIAFRRFYSRPHFMLRWLRGATNRHVVGALLRGIPSFATMWLSPDAFRHRAG